MVRLESNESLITTILVCSKEISIPQRHTRWRGADSRGCEERWPDLSTIEWCVSCPCRPTWLAQKALSLLRGRGRLQSRARLASICLAPTLMILLGSSAISHSRLGAPAPRRPHDSDLFTRPGPRGLSNRCWSYIQSNWRSFR